MQVEDTHRERSYGKPDHLPWVEKYRPHDLSDLISHESILQTLKTFIHDSNLPNMLFHGPPGTGKTSAIFAVAKEIYRKDYADKVLSLNASDQRGINVVRELIKDFAGSGSLTSNRNIKLIILDEADMMTNTAQFALRRIIEKYQSNARFCLISNYVSKIIPALQSRCTRFKFKQIPFEAASQRIAKICQAEHLAITLDGMGAVFRLCGGDMRRVVNMLQSLSMLEQTSAIEANHVYAFTGNPSPQVLEGIMNVLMNESIEASYAKLSAHFTSEGIALESILKHIYQMLIGMGMPEKQKSFLVSRLGDIEHRLSIGCKESLSLASLVGAFVEIRSM